MPKHPVSLAEHVLIHAVAVVFTFSSIFAAFLGYGVYQNNINRSSYNPVSITHGAGGAPSWIQNTFTGGVASSGTVVWGTTSWNKYSSASNVDIGSSSINLTSGQSSGNFISSILNLGNMRAGSIYFSPTSASPGGPPLYYVRGGSSEAGLNGASWNLFDPSAANCLYMPSWLGDYQYLQFKAEFTPSSSSFSSFTMFQRQLYISGDVTSSTGSAVSGATVTLSTGSSTTTAVKPSGLVSTTYAAGGYVPPGRYSFPMVTYDPTVASYTITVSKSGYTTKSQTFNVSPSSDSCDIELTANIALSPSTSNPPTSSGSTNITTNPTTTSPTVATSTFQSTKLPETFSSPGSTTTDLSKVADPKKVEGFTLDVPGKNKIVFEDSLDLSSQDTVNALKDLDKYVKIDQVGIISIDSKALPALNKKAKLTMASLKHLFTPTILVDGKKDTKVVSKPIYDKKSGKLNFTVSHFSLFAAVTKIELLSPTKVSTPNPVLKGRVSDPDATLKGSFNGVGLAQIRPDKNTGEFTIERLSFKEGANELKLEGVGALGVAAPVILSIAYSPTTATAAKTGSNAIWILAVLGITLLSLAVVGLLAIRLRKKKEKSASPSTPTFVPPVPPQPAQNLP